MTLRNWLLNNKKRNISGYERTGVASDQEAKEMFSLAKNIRSDVESWLNQTHPELIEK